jgi:hypothetical protein
MPASPDPSPEDDFHAEHERVRALAEREERVASLAKGALNLLLVAGGVTAVAAFIAPRQVAGASRTAFLDWQARDAEIDRAIACAPTKPITPGLR